MTGLDEKTFEAVQELLGMAAEDQSNYLDDGDPGIDYGAEWPESARMKAERFRLAAEFVRYYGGWSGLIDELNGLAEAFEESAKEYEEDNGVAEEEPEEPEDLECVRCGHMQSRHAGTYCGDDCRCHGVYLCPRCGRRWNEDGEGLPNECECGERPAVI